MLRIGYRRVARAPAADICSRATLHHSAPLGQVVDQRRDRAARLKAHEDLLGEIMTIEGRQESLRVWIVAAAKNDHLQGIG